MNLTTNTLLMKVDCFIKQKLQMFTFTYNMAHSKISIIVGDYKSSKLVR